MVGALTGLCHGNDAAVARAIEDSSALIRIFILSKISLGYEDALEQIEPYRTISTTMSTRC